jgi:predicted RNase H-like HicB family nuclease
MKTFKAVFERDVETGLFVGYVPGFAGAHTQGGTLEELRSNLAEVLAMLLEDGEPQLTVDFIGVESVSA